MHSTAALACLASSGSLESAAGRGQADDATADARDEDVPDDGSIHSEEALERPSHACVVEMRGHFVHRNGVGFECIKTDMP